MPLKNLIGEKFNHLTVIERAENDSNGNARWLCECDCDNHTRKIVLGFALRNKTVQSCGCLSKQPGNGSTQNLINKRFGKLITIEPTENRDSHGSVIWKCKCDCNNIIYTSVANLNRGHKQSCGCLCSIGEEKIASLLTKNNINFIREYSPNDCSNPKTGYPLRFDFAIVENDRIKYLIEYDGVQHFKEGIFGKTSLEDIQYRDKIKNDWSIMKNIPLIRIPYLDYENINIDYLYKKVKEERELNESNK